jgi:hypothetical protein
MRRIEGREEFGSLLNELGLVGTGVEIGVFQGEFAEVLLRHWHGSQLVLVDPWRHLPEYLDSYNLPDAEMHRNYEITCRRLRRFDDRVIYLRSESGAVVEEFENDTFDFIYLDANHAYKAVAFDLAAWYPKLKRGGIMSGHDYFDAYADEDFEPILEDRRYDRAKLVSYGVKSAVDEFVSRRGIRLFLTRERLPSWYFQKPTDS